MALLAAAAPYFALAGSVYSGIQQKKAGDAAEENARMVAAQQERDGIQQQAEAQRVAINETKKADYTMSRARAVAASSGGSVSDPTVQKILGDISSEGSYRSLAALYSGDTDAQLSDRQAAATRNQGRAAQRAASLSATTTILSGASDFYSKYNPTVKKPVKTVSARSPQFAGMGDAVVGGYSAGYA